MSTKRAYGRIVAATALALGLVGFSSSHVQAGLTSINPPKYSNEDNHAKIFDHLYGGSFTASGANYTNGSVWAIRLDDSMDQVFKGQILSAQAVAKFATASQGFAVKLGASGGSTTPLFDVTGNGYAVTGGTGPIAGTESGPYRFARTGKGYEFSSVDGENVDRKDHMVTYTILGMNSLHNKLINENSIKDSSITRVLFFEDTTKKQGSDFDFNDLAIETKAVPLPAAAWMGLSTLIGTVAVQGRRKLSGLFA